MKEKERTLAATIALSCLFAVFASEFRLVQGRHVLEPICQVHFILERGQKHIVIIKSGSCNEYDDEEEEDDDTTYDDTHAGEEDDDTADDDVVDDLWQTESTGTVQEVF